TAARWFLPVLWSYSTHLPSHCSGTENFSLMLDSSDDEAPEEVTFGDSKAQALQSLKEALDTAKREKELLKEKRRKRQQLFQEQKKRKLLPADVLEEIDSCLKHDLLFPLVLFLCFSLKGKYTVKTVKEQASASYQQQEAEDFIRSRLYGPGSCRTTNNELLSLQNKKGMNKSAAVQFVKKDWGKSRETRILRDSF
uniref:U3 small nucleolar RNA-associated protein NOL7 C-terminal domain-containing protein n=1 Tax=Anabas testudineus TaxID=64144 RepID=A0A3Q1IPU0_ANATE